MIYWNRHCIIKRRTWRNIKSQNDHKKRLKCDKVSNNIIICVPVCRGSKTTNKDTLINRYITNVANLFTSK